MVASLQFTQKAYPVKPVIVRKFLNREVILSETVDCKRDVSLPRRDIKTPVGFLVKKARESVCKW